MIRKAIRDLARLPHRAVRGRGLADRLASRPAAAHMTARHAISTVGVVLVTAATLASCGDDTKTVTQPASTAPLGRPIGGDRTRTREAGGQDARAAARAFLTSYLAISYGRDKPSTLRSASRALRERLRAQNPRVPPGVAKRRPRVIALRLKAVGAGRVRATGTVDDGDVAAYPLFATLARQGDGRWIAVSVGG